PWRTPAGNQVHSPIQLFSCAGNAIALASTQVGGCAFEQSLLLRFINTTTFVASLFGSGEARRGSIPRSGAVTEEQRSQNRKAAPRSGRRLFLAQRSLLTPDRPLKGMRVARASSGPKIPRRKRGRIYEMEYLVTKALSDQRPSNAGFLRSVSRLFAARLHCEIGCQWRRLSADEVNGP